jgi:hypothetical protein
MISADRLWRTADGQIVPDGHPDAAFLVAGVGGPVGSEHIDAVKAYVGEVADKANRSEVANKSTPAPATKARNRKS